MNKTMLFSPPVIDPHTDKRYLMSLESRLLAAVNRTGVKWLAMRRTETRPKVRERKSSGMDFKAVERVDFYTPGVKLFIRHEIFYFEMHFYWVGEDRAIMVQFGYSPNHTTNFKEIIIKKGTHLEKISSVVNKTFKTGFRQYFPLGYSQ